jgi:hypothetical protein
MRAIQIDSVNRVIKEIQVNGLEDLQKAVGGLICWAHELSNGDTLFVDDEGLLKEPENFFFIQGARQPFAGNGVIVGAADIEGDSTAALSSIEGIREIVAFLKRGMLS